MTDSNLITDFSQDPNLVPYERSKDKEPAVDVEAKPESDLITDYSQDPNLVPYDKSKQVAETDEKQRTAFGALEITPSRIAAIPRGAYNFGVNVASLIQDFNSYIERSNAESGLVNAIKNNDPRAIQFYKNKVELSKEREVALQKESEDTEQALDTMLPVDKDDPGTKGLMRVGEHAIGLGIGGSSLGRTVLGATVAGVGGQVAEELGFDEYGQLAAEMPGLLMGGGAKHALKTKKPMLASIYDKLIKLGVDEKTIMNVAKKFRPLKRALTTSIEKAEERGFIQAARNAGMTDDEIAPLIKKFRPFEENIEKIASKNRKLSERFEDSRKFISDFQDSIINNPSANKQIGEKSFGKMFNKFGKEYKRMSEGIKKQVEKEVNTFANSKQSINDLIDLDKRIVQLYEKEGLNLPQKLKEHIRTAISETDQLIGADYKLNQKLWEKYLTVRGRLQPDLMESLVSHAEAAGAASSTAKAVQGIITGNPENLTMAAKTFGVLLTTSGARALAREMLVNPKYMGLSSKFVNAINKGKYALASRIYTSYKNELSKKNEELGTKFPELGPEDIEKMFIKE